MGKKRMIRLALALLVLLLILGLSLVLSFLGNEDRRDSDFHTKRFGRHVYLFSPKDDPKEIQAVIDDIWASQETNQFGDERYALYFEPGIYDPSITIKIGFGTEVVGLGESPEDTEVGPLMVDAKWLGDDPSNHNACCNFWRSASNITFVGNSTWAVSQATSLRRVKVDGNLTLHDEGGWASGGFIADCLVTGIIDSGSQQQWLTRNSEFKNWTGQNWNMVFLGDREGVDPKESWPAKSYTSVDSARLIREKPYLVMNEEGGFDVIVPAAKEKPKGVSWTKDQGESDIVEGRRRISLDYFLLVDENTSVDEINEALDRGRNLYFLPGVYEISKTLEVKNDGTVILGSGLATLRSFGTDSIMKTADLPGIVIGSLLFDAGAGRTDQMLVIGAEELTARAVDESEMKFDPITLSDLFFRIGGGHDKMTDVGCALRIRSDYVVGDNFWIWRADHGDGVGWNDNRAANGLIVEGNAVQTYGLMVEHFQEYQTIWEGEDGELVMYQSELPYDVPSPEKWRSHEGNVSGYASIKIRDHVNRFSGTGIGIYCYNRDISVEETSAIELPEDQADVKLHHAMIVMLNGNPGISNVVNTSGGHVYRAGEIARLLNWPMISESDKR